MKIRKQNYGDKNLVGKNVERLRKQKKLNKKNLLLKCKLWAVILILQVIQS